LKQTSVHVYHIVQVSTGKPETGGEVASGEESTEAAVCDLGALEYRSGDIRFVANQESRELFYTAIKCERQLSELRFTGAIVWDAEDHTYSVYEEELITIGPFDGVNNLNTVLNAYSLRFGIYDHEFRLVADMLDLDSETIADSVTRLRTMEPFVHSINAAALTLISTKWQQYLAPLINDVNRQLNSGLVLDLPFGDASSD
jgi:hypothetical protein